jgi:hypothetical protein
VKADDRTLLAQLSTLNKQIVEFACRLLDTDLPAEEQLALAQRMADIGEAIRLRAEGHRPNRTLGLRPIPIVLLTVSREPILAL